MNMASYSDPSISYGEEHADEEVFRDLFMFDVVDDRFILLMGK
jgi:hypothetical protein